jgi:uncharacterized membrane protein
MYSIRRTNKKTVFTLILSLILIFSLATSASAAIGPIGFQATSSHQYDSWMINTPSGTGTINIGITITQYGLNSGNVANVKYTLDDMNGSFSQSFTVNGDKLNYTGVAQWLSLTPGHHYQLTAESLNTYTTIISMKVYAPDGTTVTQ